MLWVKLAHFEIKKILNKYFYTLKLFLIDFFSVINVYKGSDKGSVKHHFSRAAIVYCQILVDFQGLLWTYLKRLKEFLIPILKSFMFLDSQCIKCAKTTILVLKSGFEPFPFFI